MDDREQSVQYFLDLIKRSHRGKFKVYIGMIAGVGKSYRMLQEAHELLENGVDVQIGYIETHGRAGTEALLQGLPVIPRRKIFYKGKELEEMDVDAIIRIHPEIVIVDELAHTNVEGSLNEKRWQDVITLLDEGINVISAINIQHIESVNEEVQEITGIEVKERVPDSVLQEADEVVNIDLTAEELIARLKAGKIYRPEKIQTALDNFFRTENILQLRELALKEVALRVEKKVDAQDAQTELDLSALVNDALLPFEPVLFEAGHTLTARVEDGIRVRGNAAQLRQVVEILLDNARKYAQPGGWVLLTLARQGGRHCVLSVADPGAPLTPQECRDIFKRFYRVDSARAMNHSYGLGLAIAARIAEAHRGRIWAESSGGINTFYFTIPI